MMGAANTNIRSGFCLRPHHKAHATAMIDHLSRRPRFDDRPALLSVAGPTEEAAGDL